MPEQTVQQNLAQRTELIIRPQALSSTLRQIIESEPALAGRMFSLMHQKGLNLGDQEPSIRRVLAKLPVELVRSELYSAPVLQPLNNNLDNGWHSQRRELLRHNLAVACCAEELARLVWPRLDCELAYTAGLLHDIGKLALDQTMPKSLARIFELSAEKKSSSILAEQQYLGLDHSTLGRRLARKLHVPEEISRVIWLHHSDIDRLSQFLPDSLLIRVIRAADNLARLWGLGLSGSFEPAAEPAEVAQQLSIETSQIEQLRHELAGKVQQRAQVLGLGLPYTTSAYCKTLHQATASLAESNRNLASQNQRLQAASSHLEFLTEFISTVEPQSHPLEAAERLAVRWQRFYQTGKVCLYLVPPKGSGTIEAVLVEALGESRPIYLKAPFDRPLLPEVFNERFEILDAAEHTNWLFEQLETDFDLTQAKMLPLSADGKAVAVIVFEMRYPADEQLLRTNFQTSACVAGSVLNLLSISSHHERFEEKLIEVLTKLGTRQAAKPVEPAPDKTQTQQPEAGFLSAVAELAAGAAHEMNNPLSVISARAQLLAETESDGQKKAMLTQIHHNAEQLSAIIEDLMAFAKPRKPRPEATELKQLLDEAVQFASQKANTDHVNVQIDMGDKAETVFVDSAQAVCAIANIICNALESYTDSTGPIKIATGPDNTGDFAEIKISDLGYGMDTETLQKATIPFFSAKVAGRKRGMGLAHAARLIELNNGRLHIESLPGHGTTVTVYLPRQK